MIGQHGPLPAHRLRSHGAFHGPEAKTDENFDQLAIALLANKFVRRLAAPEIYCRHLKKLARGAAEELDQRAAIRPLAGFGGETQKQFLKLLVGTSDFGTGELGTWDWGTES
jgi:hypothetical protein